MAEGINIIVENYNALLSIEEKVINLQKYIKDMRTKSYMAQNLFEELREIIMRTEDVSLVSSETKNIKKVGLDMPSHPKKKSGNSNC